MIPLLTLALLQAADVRTILEKVNVARPTEKELAIWRIDWIPGFAAARKKSRDESRPLLFIWNQNISGPESLYTGHC